MSYSKSLLELLNVSIFRYKCRFVTLNSPSECDQSPVHLKVAFNISVHSIKTKLKPADCLTLSHSDTSWTG